MTTFDQAVTGRYVAAGGDRADVNARFIARAVFVPDTILGLYNADRKVGIDPSDNGSLTELVDAAEEHHRHAATDVSQRSVMAWPNTGGDIT
jgi:hypothetical protein